MKKNLIVIQDGFKECGAASLLSIIRYYKGNVPIQKLVELTHTNKSGTNFYQLKMAAQKLGMNAIGYKIDNIDLLYEIKKPFICQFVDKNYEHFVVVYEIDKNITIMDPAVGKRVISKEEFIRLHTGYILIFEPIKKLIFFKEKNYLNKTITKILLKNKSFVFDILILSIIFTVLSCLETLYFQVILSESDIVNSNILWIIFIFCIISLMKCISSFFRNELLIVITQKLDWSTFFSTFQKILLLPYHYYKNKTTGEMISRLNDLIYVKNLISKLILTVCLDGIIFLVTGIIILSINYLMFFVLMIFSLIYILIFNIFRPVLKEYTNINQHNTANINSLLTESIIGFETIKNIGMESIMNERVEKLYGQALNDSFVYENVSNLEMFLKELIASFFVLIIYFLGFILIDKNSITLGEFFSVVFISNYFLSSIQNILSLNKEFFYTKNSIKRINQILDMDSEDLESSAGIIPRGEILFSNLSFSYNGEKNILHNLSFKINKGDKVIILGNSGSGKSTILRLLMRYFEVERDCIYLDKIDINEISKKDIRASIGCISQNEILYTDTIRNNITLNEDINNYDFLEICRLVYVDDFVKEMFLGYDTMLEENGLNLSGGQCQRILLARLLLRNKSLLLIDEGLNAVDINLERRILKNIFSKYKDKTIVIVSHRMENLDLFDKTIWLEKGKIKDICDKKR